MTAQNKLKKFLKWLGSSHSHSNPCQNANAEFLNHTHPPLQRSKTECVDIHHRTDDSNQLSQSYHEDQWPHGLPEYGSAPSERQLSYRDAVGPDCPSDCECECHRHSDRSQLTLCRCAMSGYESYRKAVYGRQGGGNRVLRQGSQRRGAKDRLSMISGRRFGSTDTLASSHSNDTIKVCSDTSGASSCHKSTDTGESVKTSACSSSVDCRVKAPMQTSKAHRHHHADHIRPETFDSDFQVCEHVDVARVSGPYAVRTLMEIATTRHTKFGSLFNYSKYLLAHGWKRCGRKEAVRALFMAVYYALRVLFHAATLRT